MKVRICKKCERFLSHDDEKCPVCGGKVFDERVVAGFRENREKSQRGGRRGRPPRKKLPCD